MGWPSPLPQGSTQLRQSGYQLQLGYNQLPQGSTQSGYQLQLGYNQLQEGSRQLPQSGNQLQLEYNQLRRQTPSYCRVLHSYHREW